MIGAPAIETLGPLTLTQRYDGPWLAIPGGAPASVASLVIAGDPHTPGLWRRLDADQPPAHGSVAKAHLTPLADFGVFCTLYKHSRVLSVWVGGLSRARRLGHGAGEHWPWEGKRCDRIKIERNVVELLTLAVKDCNAMGRVPASVVSDEDFHDLTVGRVRA